jgi:predicted RNase H-like HicB family nuclease
MSGTLRYTVVIESGSPGANLSGFVPDLPGCVSTGDDLAELKRNLCEAIQLHLHGLREDGETVPQPATPATRNAVLEADPELAEIGGADWVVDFVDVLDDPEVWRQGVITLQPRRRSSANRA